MFILPADGRVCDVYPRRHTQVPSMGPHKTRAGQLSPTRSSNPPALHNLDFLLLPYDDISIEH